MAKAPLVHIIHLEAIDAEPGFWCQTCLLPSAWRITYVMNEHTVGSHVWCPACAH